MRRGRGTAPGRRAESVPSGDLPKIPASAVRRESHPGHAPRLVAIFVDGEWRAWVINLDGPAAIAAADQLAAAIRGAPHGDDPGITPGRLR